jgi:hypothetical protein
VYTDWWDSYGDVFRGKVAAEGKTCRRGGGDDSWEKDQVAGEGLRMLKEWRMLKEG